MTTAPVGLPQNTNISAATPTAPIPSAVRCAQIHWPTGPVRSPASSPRSRTQRRPMENTARVWTALT